MAQGKLKARLKKENAFQYMKQYNTMSVSYALNS